MKKVIVTLMAMFLLSTTAFGQQGMKRGHGGGGDGDWDGRRNNQSYDHGRKFGCDQRGHGFEGRRGGAPGGGIGHIMAMADMLELSDQQVDQLKESMVAFQMERIDQQAELQKARLHLRMLKHDSDASEAAVMKAIDKMSQLRAELQKMKYRHHKSMKSVLTDEQKAKLEEHKMNPPGDKPGRSFKQRRGFGG